MHVRMRACSNIDRERVAIACARMHAHERIHAYADAVLMRVHMNAPCLRARSRARGCMRTCTRPRMLDSEEGKLQGQSETSISTQQSEVGFESRTHQAVAWWMQEDLASYILSRFLFPDLNEHIRHV